jgi:hypothetical protein
MKSPFPHARLCRARFQQGAAVVEFALVAVPFLLLLLGAIEFGRLMYLWNTVQEVTRNAARQAVVTDFTHAGEIAAIKKEAVFGVGSASKYFLPAASEVSNETVVIRYLNASYGEVAPKPSSPADNVAACADSGRANQCIAFVEACVSTDGQTCASSIEITSLLSLPIPLPGALKIPLSTVRMPAESLGFRPGG